MKKYVQYLARKLLGTRPFGRPTRKLDNSNEINVKLIGCEDRRRVKLAQHRVQWRYLFSGSSILNLSGFACRDFIIVVMNGLSCCSG